MTTTEDLLRALSPQVLGVLARRVGSFPEAEDAVQEALLAAAGSWPADGVPDDPAGWLHQVAFRRFVDAYRSDRARHRRELVAATWSSAAPPSVESTDDTLTCMYLCAHPVLPPTLAIPLTLRAVGGLTTAEIAAGFFLPGTHHVNGSAAPRRNSRPRTHLSRPRPASSCRTGCAWYFTSSI